MQTLGNYLKKGREARNFSLSDISDYTKISKIYLDSLEKDDYTKFPAELYVKGYISSYASCVGIDEHKALKLYKSYQVETNDADDIEAGLLQDKPKSIPLFFRFNKKIWFTLVFCILIILAIGAYYLRSQSQKTDTADINLHQQNKIVQQARKSTKESDLPQKSGDGNYFQPVAEDGFKEKLDSMGLRTKQINTISQTSDSVPAHQPEPNPSLPAHQPELKSSPATRQFASASPLPAHQPEPNPPLPAHQPEPDSSSATLQMEPPSRLPAHQPESSPPSPAHQPEPDASSATHQMEPPSRLPVHQPESSPPLPTHQPELESPLASHQPEPASPLPIQNSENSAIDTVSEKPSNLYSRMDDPPPATKDPTHFENNLKVLEAAACNSITGRVPQGFGDTFEWSIDRIFVWTRIKCERPPDSIRHIYYFKGQKVNDILLQIRSSNWRTWTYKTLADERYIGPWRVDITSADGNLLQSIHFEIK